MKSKIIASYFRHLIFLAYGALLAVSKVDHTSIMHISKGELAIVGQSLWIAVLPQLRHTVEPAINFYLKKKYPGLGIILADVKAVTVAPISEVPTI